MYTIPEIKIEILSFRKHFRVKSVYPELVLTGDD